MALACVPSWAEMMARSVQRVTVILTAYALLDRSLAVLAAEATLALASPIAHVRMTSGAVLTRIASTLVHVQVTIATQQLRPGRRVHIALCGILN